MVFHCYRTPIWNGSRQVGHLARELRRTGGKYGIVTMCVGGGMGATGLFESIPE